MLSAHNCSLRMFKLVLLFLTVSGLQAVPQGWRKTRSTYQLPDGFQQGTEHSVVEGLRQVAVDIPAQMSGGGWVRVEESSAPYLPDGFRQGTEPFMSIPDGFKQGTEPFVSMPDGFRQGTEPFISIPTGFRQGTEPFASGIQTQIMACKGEVINRNCYEFNPTPMAFLDAQIFCRALAPTGELASVTSGDLHSHLVSLVTKGGGKNPVLTWLGGMVKNQQSTWVDGSEWGYSDWMPGHPNIYTDKPVCVEMFKMDEGWWTAADCELKRASICSYPVTDEDLQKNMRELTS